MKIGYNKLNITPNNPVHIAGYNRKSMSIGELDPIEINTLIITQEQKTIIFSILDSIIIEDSVIIPVKENISKMLDIPTENIIIGCIHTHSAPAYFKPFFENVFIDDELQKSLVPSFVKSIEAAFHDLQEATLTLSKTTIEGLYGNRNVKDGPADKDVHIIHFMNSHSKKEICSFIRMSCHPTILNGTNLKLSSDLLGWVRKKYQEKTNVPCMIVNGYCGDVSTRFYRQLKGEDELERVSSHIIEQLENTQIINTQPQTLKSTVFTKSYTYNGQTDSFVQSEIPHLQSMINETNEEFLKGYYTQLLHNLKFKASKGEMILPLSSHIVLLGNILFFTLPGDITAKLGQRIIEQFPDYEVFVIGYCENYSNYFVCEKDYGKYFETYISRLSKGNADDFIQNVIDTAKQLIK